MRGYKHRTKVLSGLEGDAGKKNFIRGDTLCTGLEMTVKNTPVWTTEVYSEKCERL